MRICCTIFTIGDLSWAVGKETVENLAEETEEDSDEWKKIEKNLYHIYDCMLSATVILNENKYQHYDVKGTINNFINKSRKVKISPIYCKTGNVNWYN